MTYVVGIPFPDQNLGSVKAQGAALGDGIHIPALGLRLGEEAVGYSSFLTYLGEEAVGFLRYSQTKE